MSRFLLRTNLFTLLTLLALSVGAQAQQQFWDGSTTAGDGLIHGGSGTWTTLSGSTNWTTATGTPNSGWGSGDAVFTVALNGTGTYTVSLPASLSATSLSFRTGGYSITGGGTLTLTGTSVIHVAEGAATINSSLASTNTLSKTGAGLLILNGDGSGLTGGLTVNAGSLQNVQTTTGTLSTAFGPGTLTLNGGVGLQTYVQLTGTTSVNYGNNVAVNGTVLFINDRGGAGTGAGAGAGVTNTFGTLLLNGNLVDQASSQASTGTSGINFGATTLAGNSSIQSLGLTAGAANVVTLASIDGSAGNYNLTFAGGSATINGTINLGSGNLNKTNTGILTLNGSVSTTGTININQQTTGNVILGGLGATSAVFAGAQNILVNGGNLTLGAIATTGTTSSSGTVNRISDTATLTLAGGNLALSNVDTLDTEKVGTLNLGVGISQISSSGGSGTKAQIVSFGNLGARATGATIDFAGSVNVGVNGSTQFYGTAPTVTNGIIGGWATVGNGFATISGTNVIALPSGNYLTEGNFDFTGNATPVDVVQSFTNIPTTVALSGNNDIYAFSMNGTVSGTYILDLGGFNLNIGSGGIISTGGNSQVYSLVDGTVTAGNGSSPAELFLNMNSTQKFNLGATIADNTTNGPTSLVADGVVAYSLFLSGANTYTGGTFLENGITWILTDRQFGAEPSSLDADNITLSNGATLRFDDWAVPAAISSNRGIVLAAGGGTIYGSWGGGDFDLASPISGSGSIDFSFVNNTTKMTISGASTFDGPVTIGQNAGGNININYTSIGNIGSTTPTSLGDPTTAANGVITIQGNSGIFTYVGTGASTTDREIVDTNIGQITFAASGAGALTLNGNLIYNSNSGPNIGLGGYGVGILNGNIIQTSNVAQGIVKSGNGTWRLTGENTYTGVTSITAGVLEFTTIGNIGSGPSSLGNPTASISGTVNSTAIQNGTIGLSNGTLRFVGTTAQSSDRILSLTNNASVETTSTAPITFTGGVLLGTKILTLGGTGQGFFSGTGVLTNGSLTMAGLTGQGIWTLNQSAVNTYTGATSVNGGTLVVDFSNLASATNLINSASTLSLGGGTFSIVGKSNAATSQRWEFSPLPRIPIRLSALTVTAIRARP